jgi:hypothetical protein
MSEYKNCVALTEDNLIILTPNQIFTSQEIQSIVKLKN